MAVENSRMKGFYQFSVKERLNLIKAAAGLSDEATNALGSFAELDIETANRMVENVIGTMSLPIGIATNFVIDSKHYLIPLCTEEASVVAAASNMAKRCLKNGGFFTECDPPLMIAQIQVLDVEDIPAAEEAIAKAKESLISQCNDVESTMIRRGGGCKSILTRVIKTQ
ncbi:MAG: hydroxymethylglutaryl-CoA reductase, degradative, partial [Candidatus Poseidoniales archaeon]